MWRRTADIRTDLCVTLHLEHLCALDHRCAGVVDAVEHRLACICMVSDGVSDESLPVARWRQRSCSSYLELDHLGRCCHAEACVMLVIEEEDVS